jgi:capsular polysaccharide biosynthesis protein
MVQSQARMMNRGHKIRIKLGAMKSSLMPFFLSAWPARAWRVLPGNSASFGPPRRLSTWAAYRARTDTGAGWYPAMRGGEMRMPPGFIPAPHRGTLDRDEVAWPDTGVAVVPGARVLQRPGWVLGKGDCLLWEFHSVEIVRQLKAYHLLVAPPLRRLEGRTLHLANNWAELNYFHWMIEAMPKAEIFRRAGFSWDDVDHILMPVFRSPTADALVRAIGLPMEKVIRLENHHHFICDELLLPGPMAILHSVPPWVVAWHRALFPVPESPALPRLRLYMLRRSNRRVVEEKAVAAKLRAAGFIEAADENWPALREQLARATHVVAVHGAAMTNLVYLRRGARVLELVPSHNPYRYYRTLCAALDCPHSYLLGRSTGWRKHWHTDNPNYDFTIDPVAFDRSLEALLAN